MKVLITGNATCANRGDAAIFRGLIHEIQSQRDDVQLVCCSRHPVASSVVLGQTLEPDWLYESELTSGSTLQKAKGMIGNRFKNDSLRWIASGRTIGKFLSTPTSITEFNERISDVDAVIHVGGSFFVDLYGERQFSVMMACAVSNKPVYFAGHSLGPFRFPRVKRFAETFLPTAKRIYLREQASQPMLDELNVTLGNVSAGADTAWIMPDHQPNAVFDAELGDVKRPLVAVTVRKLVPFDVRLGITQQQYESNVAQLLDSIVDKGYHIIGVSMCTGLGGYAHDDRLIAESVRGKLQKPECMTVLWNEYNDLQIGAILKRCELLVGTRLHSVIISLRYETPAIALYYEHKSAGVLANLGLSQWSIKLQDVATDATLSQVNRILDDPKSARSKVRSAVAKEQTVAREMVRQILDDISMVTQS